MLYPLDMVNIKVNSIQISARVTKNSSRVVDGIKNCLKEFGCQ